MYTKMFMEVLLMSVTHCEQSIYQEGTAWINYITSVQQNTIGSLKKKMVNICLLLLKDLQHVLNEKSKFQKFKQYILVYVWFLEIQTH